MIGDDEIMSRLIKSLTSGKYALDQTQLEVALGGVERILANNLQPLSRIFAPFVPVVNNAQLDKLRDENYALQTQIDRQQGEIERLKFQLLQQAKQKVIVKQHPENTTFARRPWTAEEYQRGIRMFSEGASWSDVACSLGRREGEVKGKFINRPPDEVLLGESIEIHIEGPMSFYELWKIASDLFGEGWRSRLESRFNLPAETILWNPPETFLDDKQMHELREWWQRRRSMRAAKTGKYTLNNDMEKLRTEIHNAGPRGMTQREMEESGVITPADVGFRRYDLVKLRLIFDSGNKHGRSILWVDSAYRDHYPEAWKTTMAELDKPLQPEIVKMSG